jgi:hypothetical protein
LLCVAVESSALLKKLSAKLYGRDVANFTSEMFLVKDKICFLSVILQTASILTVYR